MIEEFVMKEKRLDVRLFLQKFLQKGYRVPLDSQLIIPEVLSPDRAGCEVLFSLTPDGFNWMTPIRCGFTRVGCEGQGGRHGLGS